MQIAMLTKTTTPVLPNPHQLNFIHKPGPAGSVFFLNPRNDNRQKPHSLFLPPSLQNPTPSPSMALSLSLIKPRRKSLSNPSLLQLFSSSSIPPPNDQNAPETPPSAQPPPPLSSYLSDVKASLTNKKQTPSNQNHQSRTNFPPLRRPTFPNTNAKPQTPSNLEEIRKNLSHFRSRSSVPPPTEASNSASRQQYNHVSMRELYQKRIMEEQESGSPGGSGSGIGNKPFPEKLSFDTIRESLRQMRPSEPAKSSGGNESMFSPFRLKQGNENPGVICGTEGLPAAVFGKEMKEREENSGEETRSTEFLRHYNHDELGEKLRKLRPEEVKNGAKKGSFSIAELNERLRKLGELEIKASESRRTWLFNDLKQSLEKATIAEAERANKNSVHRLNLLGQVGAPDFMLLPPKEELVEKYFHPDKMSSSEKLKIELAKVRDEFKMSESDCGSARVQVAQLTLKIKHLASMLHKKDKHSRKGLVGMVQKRKKLLKYLRRTDWDSYCFVLSKLGLRDNPDYKMTQ